MQFRRTSSVSYSDGSAPVHTQARQGARPKWLIIVSLAEDITRSRGTSQADPALLPLHLTLQAQIAAIARHYRIANGMQNQSMVPLLISDGLSNREGCWPRCEYADRDAPGAYLSRCLVYHVAGSAVRRWTSAECAHSGIRGNAAGHIA